jgi:hypothetical protein
MSAATDEKFDRNQMARWHARRHLETDAGVEHVHFLPTNAPDREIRLLEVNRLISEATDLEPIDFGVDVGGSAQHTLLVLDVTPAQWGAITKGQLALPPSWTLEGSQEIGARNHQ